MARQILYSTTSRLWTAGVHALPEVTVPAGATIVEIYATREGWPSAGTILKEINGKLVKHEIEIIHAKCKISYDGGQSWPDWFAVSDTGGDIRDRLGNPQDTHFPIMLPQVGIPNRRLRGFVTITLPAGIDSIRSDVSLRYE